MYISHSYGLGGHFDSNGHNCVFCEVHSSKLHVQDEPSEVRTLERHYHLCHLPLYSSVTVGPDGVATFPPFTCPGCFKTFKTQADIDADTGPGDTDAKQKKWLQDHFNVSWRRTPLLDIDPMRQITCELHLELSICKTLWTKCILPCVDSDEKVEQLHKRLHQIGCLIRYAYIELLP